MFTRARQSEECEEKRREGQCRDAESWEPKKLDRSGCGRRRARASSRLTCQARDMHPRAMLRRAGQASRPVPSPTIPRPAASTTIRLRERFRLLERVRRHERRAAVRDVRTDGSSPKDLQPRLDVEPRSRLVQNRRAGALRRTRARRQAAVAAHPRGLPSGGGRSRRGRNCRTDVPAVAPGGWCARTKSTISPDAQRRRERHLLRSRTDHTTRASRVPGSAPNTRRLSPESDTSEA